MSIKQSLREEFEEAFDKDHIGFESALWAAKWAIERAAKVAEETVCGCRLDKKCCADIQSKKSSQAIRNLAKELKEK